MLIKDSEGKDINVLSQEEFNEKLAEENKKFADSFSEQIKKENEAVIKGLREEFEKKNKSQNNNDGNDNQDIEARIKEIEENANKKIEDVTKQVDSFKQSTIDNSRDALIAKLSGGDTDLIKKTKAYYDMFKGVPANQDEIISRVQDAFRLAKPDVKPNVIDSIRNGVGDGASTIDHARPTTLTDNAVAIGNALGITEEDRKKYGPKN